MIAQSVWREYSEKTVREKSTQTAYRAAAFVVEDGLKHMFDAPVYCRVDKNLTYPRNTQFDGDFVEQEEALSARTGCDRQVHTCRRKVTFGDVIIAAPQAAWGGN